MEPDSHDHSGLRSPADDISRRLESDRHAPGLVRAVRQPARGLPGPVRGDQHGLISANALMQMAMMGVRIVGPAAAGALVAAFGPNICYTLDVASFVASASLIGTVAIVRPPAEPKEVNTRSGIHAVLHDMGEGMRFITHHPALSFVV